MLVRKQRPLQMWLMSLSVSCVVFNKAVFSGLLSLLDVCYFLTAFAGSIKFHSSSLGLSPRKETEKRERIPSVTLDLKPFPAQVWLRDKGGVTEASV